MSIILAGERFRDIREATDFVRSVGIPAGDGRFIPGPGALVDYEETFMLDGEPFPVRWTFGSSEVSDLGVDDLPWGNGTDRVCVDGRHVREVRWTEVRVRLNEALMEGTDCDFLAFMARMIGDTPWQATWIDGAAVLNRTTDGALIGTFETVE